MSYADNTKEAEKICKETGHHGMNYGDECTTCEIIAALSKKDEKIASLLTENKELELEFAELKTIIKDRGYAFQEAQTKSLLKIIKLENKISEQESLINGMRKALDKIDCTCVLGKSLYTKNPSDHAELCAYRIAMEALKTIDELKKEK